MTIVLWLLFTQGVLGAFDTLYFHEWRARLVARMPGTRPELVLHAARSIIYSIVFGTLPWFAWRGAMTFALAALLFAEIVITLADFVVEDKVRAPLGGVFPVERVMHTVMAIVYGAMLANVVPVMIGWSAEATAIAPHAVAAPAMLRGALCLMSAGVLLSGLRDGAAAMRLPYAAWPWKTV